MVAKEWKIIPLPDSVSFETGATVWHVYGTAHYALVERARAQRGETVFITGAAGGVGLAAVDLSRHLGLRIIAGIGTDDKADLVRSYGAAEVVNYRSSSLHPGHRTLPSSPLMAWLLLSSCGALWIVPLVS
jgi:NADPH2:quinone reductase